MISQRGPIVSRHRLLLAALAVAALVAAACGSGSGSGDAESGAATGTAGEPPPAEPATESPAAAEQTLPDDPGGRGTLAGLDTSIRSVELADIHFDLFNGYSISLAEASEEGILALADLISPLDAARDLLPADVQNRVGTVRYISAEAATFLMPNMVVLGYIADDGQAYAYSLGILQFHELVNDTVGGRAILISYCPLCRSAVVYDRVVDGQVLTFGNTSALFQNDLVMFDRQTTSYWFQIGGEAVVGTLTGQRLTPLPSSLMPWET